MHTLEGCIKKLGSIILIPELVLLLTAATYHCKPHATIIMSYTQQSDKKLYVFKIGLH